MNNPEEIKNLLLNKSLIVNSFICKIVEVEYSNNGKISLTLKNEKTNELFLSSLPDSQLEIVLKKIIHEA